MHLKYLRKKHKSVLFNTSQKFSKLPENFIPKYCHFSTYYAGQQFSSTIYSLYLLSQTTGDR